MVVLTQAKANPRSLRLRPSDRGESDRPKPGWVRVSKKQRAQAVELYVSGMSAVAVGREVGIGKSTVLEIVRKAGVEVRPWGKRAPGTRHSD